MGTIETTFEALRVDGFILRDEEPPLLASIDGALKGADPKQKKVLLEEVNRALEFFRQNRNYLIALPVLGSLEAKLIEHGLRSVTLADLRPTAERQWAIFTRLSEKTSDNNDGLTPADFKELNNERLHPDPNLDLGPMKDMGKKLVAGAVRLFLYRTNGFIDPAVLDYWQKTLIGSGLMQPDIDQYRGRNIQPPPPVTCPPPTECPAPKECPPPAAGGNTEGGRRRRAAAARGAAGGAEAAASKEVVKQPVPEEPKFRDPEDEL